MKEPLILKIVSILNNQSDIKEKKIDLRKLKKYKHKENRLLIEFICSLLDDFILPIHFDEQINFYNIKDVSENNYAKLCDILKLSTFDRFNAICNELLWDHYHKVDFAKNALHMYTVLLENNECDEDVSLYNKYAVAICRIYSKYNDIEYNFLEFVDKTLAYIKTQYGVKNFCILFMLRALLFCRVCEKTTLEAFKEAILYYEKETEYEKSISYLKVLVEYYDDTKNNSEKDKTQVRVAKNYEKEARKMDWSSPENSHRIILLIHKAMNAWSKSNNKNKQHERKRLAKDLIPIKKMSIQTLQKTEYPPIDVADIIEKLKTNIESSSFEESVRAIAYATNLKTPKDIEKEMRKDGFFAGVPATSILDSEGRIIAIVPSKINANDKEKLLLIENRAMEEYGRAIWFINSYLLLAREKFVFTEENLEFIVTDNAFIPEDRRNTFLKGLVAGFNFELSTAMHLLMPQVENSIRCLAEECGIVTYKTHEDGTEESLSLDSILSLEEISEYLDDVLLFNFRVFYTSSCAFNMRNIVAHGLYSDEELSSGSAFIVWWFTLRICCMYSRNLRKRISKQRTEYQGIKDTEKETKWNDDNE